MGKRCLLPCPARPVAGMERRGGVKTFILEGGDIDQKNLFGKPIMRGWRHYKVVSNGKTAGVISQRLTVEKAAAEFSAKLFPRGTWEDPTKQPQPGFFPFPRQEIAQEIYS